MFAFDVSLQFLFFERIYGILSSSFLKSPAQLVRIVCGQSDSYHIFCIVVTEYSAYRLVCCCAGHHIAVYDIGRSTGWHAWSTILWPIVSAIRIEYFARVNTIIMTDKEYVLCDVVLPNVVLSMDN